MSRCMMSADSSLRAPASKRLSSRKFSIVAQAWRTVARSRAKALAQAERLAPNATWQR